jgi:hypothetical protein
MIGAIFRTPLKVKNFSGNNMLLFEVTNEFNTQLRAVFGSKNDPKTNMELYNFLHNHPSKEKVISNACNQVLIYERKYRTRLSILQRNVIIRECVQLWARTLIEMKEQQMMSRAKQNELKEKEDLKKEMNEILEEK